MNREDVRLNQIVRVNGVGTKIDGTEVDFHDKDMIVLALGEDTVLIALAEDRSEGWTLTFQDLVAPDAR